MCRYTAQNAKALLEAKTALITGEIKTPSQCSRWTSEGAYSEDGAVDKKSSSDDATAASSGKEYKVSECEESSATESFTSDKDYVEDSQQSHSEYASTGVLVFYGDKFRGKWHVPIIFLL